MWKFPSRYFHFDKFTLHQGKDSQNFSRKGQAYVGGIVGKQIGGRRRVMEDPKF